MQDKTKAYKILIGKPLGKRKHTGSDDSKMDAYLRLWKCELNWAVVKRGSQWKVFVNKVMNF
jgi:hypothetical protein